MVSLAVVFLLLFVYNKMIDMCARLAAAVLCRAVQRRALRGSGRLRAAERLAVLAQSGVQLEPALALRRPLDVALDTVLCARAFADRSGLWRCCCCCWWC